MRALQIIAASCALLSPSLALAQSAPNWSYGYTPSAGEFRKAFTDKQDKLPYTPVSPNNPVFTGAATAPKFTITGPGSTGDVSGMSVPQPSNGKLNLLDAFGPAIRPEAYSCACNGTADDTNALINANNAAIAAGTILEISKPTRAASNISFGVPVRIRSGKLIASGATVTLTKGATAFSDEAFEIRDSGSIDFAGTSLQAAPLRRQFVFTGTGAGTVSGLGDDYLEWFVAHARGSWASPPTIEVRGLVQKGVAALANNGTMSAGTGLYLINGSQPVVFDRGQSFKGAGRLKTGFLWTGAATNGFYSQSAGTSYAALQGFMFRMATAGTIPTSGTAVLVENPASTVQDIYVDDPYEGLVHNNVNTGTARDFFINGAAKAGWRITNSLDIQGSDYVIQALYDWMTVTPTSGTLQNGEAVTLSSGQTGHIVFSYGNNRYRVGIEQNRKKPLVGATITGGTSGATATISAYQAGHALGGVRWEGHNEAINQSAFDVLGGDYSWTTTGTGSPIPGTGYGPAYNRMGSGYFDTSYYGSSVSGLYGTVLSGTWFASAGNSGAAGLSISNSHKIRGFGVQLVNNADAGVFWDGTSDDIEFHGLIAEGNTLLSGQAEITAAANAKNWKIIGGSAGGPGRNSAKDAVALFADTGTTGLVSGFTANTQAATKIINNSAGGVTFSGNFPKAVPGLNVGDAKALAFSGLVAANSGTASNRYFGPAGVGGLNEQVFVVQTPGTVTRLTVQVNVAPGGSESFAYQVIRVRNGGYDVVSAGSITGSATSLDVAVNEPVLPGDRLQVGLTASANAPLSAHSGVMRLEP